MSISELDKDAVRQELRASKNTFKGYSLKQIKYRKAEITLEQRELDLDLREELGRIKNRGIIRNAMGVSPKWSTLGNIGQKIYRSLNYIDYAVSGVKVFNKVSKISKLARIFK